jgi:antitoxin component YwqK of YwqJK toxin-antitoxin module
MIPMKSYHPNGNIEAEGFLIENVQVGKWTFYHENGQLFTEGEFDNNGNPVGVWTEYYLNGQKKYEAISEQRNSFSISNNNLQILNYWTDDGEHIIKDGKGTLIIFFDNGNVKQTSVWSGNMKNGMLKEFYQNGKIKIESYYKEGVRSGESKIFHENGHLYIVCYYDDGKATGQYKEWYENGQLCETGFYKNEKYFIDSFWDDSGTQRLYNGTGYVIRKQVADQLDIYKQDFENYIMTKETRL